MMLNMTNAVRSRSLFIDVRLGHLQISEKKREKGKKDQSGFQHKKEGLQ
jgi:hypothetical protein